jgi:DNA repair protein RadD
MATGFNLEGVGRVGGDYNQGKLQAAVNTQALNEAVIDEVVKYGTVEGAERKAWLLFCSGVEHARDIRDEIRGRGISCETVTGETPAAERDRIIADFKAGRIRALTNNSVLTTGTNIPAIDLVAFLRPTLSAGLYVQMAGRGLRLHPGKENCLFLDFAGVVRKHGPIDAVVPPHERSGTGDAPIKQCPQDEGGCGSLVHASAKVCPDCGYEFPMSEEPKISRQAEDVSMLSRDAPSWRAVNSRTFRFHEAKSSEKPPSVKVSYMVGMTAFNEWCCPQHQGFAKSKADRWWSHHGGLRPFPATVMEWLERQRELRTTEAIQVRPNGRYWDIIGHKTGDHVAANDNAEPAANDNGVGYATWEELDDEIPF